MNSEGQSTLRTAATDGDPHRRAATTAGGRLEMLIPKVAFCLSLVAIGFGYGYICHRYGLPPQSLITRAKQGLEAVMFKIAEERPWYLVSTEKREAAVTFDPAIAPGLTLYAAITAKSGLVARVIERDGTVVAEWVLDWFKIWPDATHLDSEIVPKSAPGTFLHSMLFMEDGGLIFNYEALGMVRVDALGNVVWRLPYRTHHSLFGDDEGNIWSPGQKTRKEAMPEWPLYIPPFQEFTIVKVSPDGRIIQEISVFEILRQNGLHGLLYEAARDGMQPDMTGDTLHLNDVEVFGSAMAPGFFQPGDVMFSLRNLNAVLVFEPETWKVKYLSIGKVVRQHDPDFLDGHTISIFDNNHVGTRADGIQSRIIRESVPSGSVQVAFEGTPALPFFTDIMGKNQWLPDGNLLLLEATGGRILEVDRFNQPVWEFNNLVEDGVLGAVTDVVRLPPEINADRLAEYRRLCAEKHHVAEVAHRPN